MKQSFLDSLEGLFLDQADALIEAEGLITYSLPEGVVAISIARPNTVMIWVDDYNVVIAAKAGDGEVEQG